MSGPAKIRRGQTRPGRQPPKRKTPSKRKPSATSRALATIPIAPAKLRRAGNWALGGLLGAGFIAGIMAMQLPQMIGIEVGEAVGRAGFVVRNVEIVGRQKADRDIVYDVAMEQQSRAMPLVDLEGTRAKLMQLGWIADARVSRRLPDTLVVDIVERKPAAIWQHRQRLALIDKDGVVIAPVDYAQMPDLPVVIGPGANRRATELSALLEAAPSLKPMLEGATWIGSRRWDLRFQSGETLALPEGQKAAADALAYFAKQDAQVRLLGQGFVRFDLRDPKRMVVRVSKEPGRQIADPDTKSI
jgi:cell division protein FtsQ